MTKLVLNIFAIIFAVINDYWISNTDISCGPLPTCFLLLRIRDISGILPPMDCRHNSRYVSVYIVINFFRKRQKSDWFPPSSDAAVNLLEQPTDQLVCARLLAPRHDARQEGVPPVPPDHAQRIPPEEVQELERMAKVVGSLHQLLPLLLQDLPGGLVGLYINSSFTTET